MARETTWSTLWRSPLCRRIGFTMFAALLAIELALGAALAPHAASPVALFRLAMLLFVDATAAGLATFWILGRLLLGPLLRLSKEVRDAAASVGEFEPTATVSSTGVREIDRIGGAVNDLLGRVGDAMTSIRVHETAELRRLATHDALTGLPNRGLFLQRLAENIRATASAERPLGVMLLGLDGFKSVNSAYGQRIGDLVLQEVAHRIASEPHPRASLSRIQGDEFAALWPGMTNLDAASGLGRRLLRRIAEPFHVDGYELNLRASIGVALAPADGKDAEQLLAHANVAMDRAKADGGDRIQYFSADLNVHLQRQRELESALRRALKARELELHYQPKFDIATNRLIGAEALMRWRHPEEGMMSPGEFIPLAERTGLITPMGVWALHEACRQAAIWRRSGMGDLHVAVNLSAVQLREAGLLDTVIEALAATGLPPHLLELELTETMLMEHRDHLAATLEGLSALGVRLSIDDFGTGYSSLSYLKRFPVHGIKIDRSFVADMIGKTDAITIVRAIVGLGHSLGLSVVAEGVETPEQLDLLAAEGCDHAQGFLLGRPMPADAFSRRFAAIAKVA